MTARKVLPDVAFDAMLRSQMPSPNVASEELRDLVARLDT